MSEFGSRGHETAFCRLRMSTEFRHQWGLPFRVRFTSYKSRYKPRFQLIVKFAFGFPKLCIIYIYIYTHISTFTLATWNP